MKKFFDEFKEFALKGNVMDMAVGIIIGAAFKAIVDSLVGDLINPLLGLVGGTDFSSFVWVINGVSIRYGSFITAIINFIIMAFIIFLMIKAINSIKNVRFLRKKQAEKDTPAPITKECPFCKSEVKIDATRCPHCTSIIEETEPK